MDIVLEDFENYDSENTVVVGNRVGGSGFTGKWRS